jgi:8-oxo-dGTP diphosphatase
VQIREKSLPPEELTTLTRRALDIARSYGARVLLNGDATLACGLGADGVHLTAHRLMSLDARPPLEWVGASCHDEHELSRAVALGVDFVVLGSVAETASHPGGKVLGWERFAALLRDYPLPVYAVGGLRAEHLDDAWANGAHGIAAIRGCWLEQG